ncbi:MAG TPA: hypothetical protein VGB51_00530 [Actinomycetota bacterium]
MRSRVLLAASMAAALSMPAGSAVAGGPLEARLRTSAFTDMPVTAGSSAPSMLRGMRQLQRGTLPEGTVLVGDETPAPLATGAAQTLQVLDVDGDGTQELVQVRGLVTAPKLALTDGATGALRWSRSLSSYAFALRLVPDGAGNDDLLVFVSGTVQRIDAATGTQLWSRSLPSGDYIGYWGVSPSPDGGDLVVGAWTFPYPQVVRLQLEFRSLATGTTRGTRTIDGEGDYPSAALAGDLNGDAVGDVFTLAPLYSFSAYAGGMLEAVGSRGASVIWSAPVAVPVSDFAWLVDGSDVTGDGTGDAVVFSEWLGADGATPTEDVVTIVDGDGGTTAGLDPVGSFTLQGFPSVLETPGDLNGDGGKDLVFSGAVYSPGEGAVKVLFEAIGRGGAIWTSGPGYPTPISDLGYAWWPLGGDLDGDGVEDALVLLGTGSGPDLAVGVSKRTGAALWQRESLGGTWMVPVFADLTGDGGDDAASVDAYHPDASTTRFDLAALDGRDLAPLWSHVRVLDSGANGWSFNVDGGRFGPGTTEDLALELNMQGGARHFSEVLRGTDGVPRWTDPTT